MCNTLWLLSQPRYLIGEGGTALESSCLDIINYISSVDMHKNYIIVHVESE